MSEYFFERYALNHFISNTIFFFLQNIRKLDKNKTNISVDDQLVVYFAQIFASHLLNLSLP